MTAAAPEGNPFFDHPIINSPYEYPLRHWELDPDGQPTQQVIETRRPVSLITPIPRTKRQRSRGSQIQMVATDDAGLSTERQEYDPCLVAILRSPIIDTP